jgi:hypothetical protein
MRLPPDFVAQALECRFDHARIAREIMSCSEFFVYTPPYERQLAGALSGEIPFLSESAENYRRIDTFERRGAPDRLAGASIFYLRSSTENDVTRDSRFSVNKKLAHSSWFWRPALSELIPYTIECIESLPYRSLGLVRAFVCRDTFMPTHRDTAPEWGCDKTQSIGLSLIPATGGVPMLIWDDAAARVRELHGHCLVFDDSKWHGVPMTRGTRITLRVFGELEFERLEERLAERAAA